VGESTASAVAQTIPPARGREARLGSSLPSRSRVGEARAGLDEGIDAELLWCFPTLWAVNLSWQEEQERRVESYAVPEGWSL
jgi:hypothetical protein